ncbi:MAG: metallophosphoesterase [Ignavibacteria bacterium]|nr:metallophosphoesterase [Ignavibacteria bacterium]
MTVGNHDVQHRFDEDNFRKAFPDMPQNGPDDEKGLTYSFDFLNTHFIMITTNRWYYGNPDDTTDDRRDWRYVKHIDWLENDIISAKEKGAELIFVLSHEPAFPVGGHLRDCLPNLGKDVKLPLDSVRNFYLTRRNEFWNILSKYNVSAYICGHEHLYGRQLVGGVFQITAGSAGAPLYAFNPLFENTVPDNPALDREFKSYDEALPYYEILNYNFGPGKNSQASEDFIGYTAFHYCIFEVNGKTVKVSVLGAFPKQGTNDVLGTEIKQIDSFVIGN